MCKGMLTFLGQLREGKIIMASGVSEEASWEKWDWTLDLGRYAKVS